MNLLVLGTLCVAILLLSWWLTEAFRRYALARGMLDIPNERSSHHHPTPRGGGMAIVLSTLAGFVTLGATGALTWRQVIGFGGAGALVATIGFVDDRRKVRRRWRLAAHIAAAVGVLLSIDLPSIDLFGIAANGWAGRAIILIGIVWLINLTNFMDGLDGLAGLEVVTVSVAAVVLYASSGVPSNTWTAPLVVAAATLGFLRWNWPPAKVFMGDVGSGFLGVILAALGLQAAAVNHNFLAGWLILLAVFIVDASVTLVRRIMRSERIYRPHRTHAYQHAAVTRGAHAPVTVAVGIINLVWLLPMALLAVAGVLPGIVAVTAAYVPLIIAAWQLGAGTSRGQTIATAKSGTD